MEKLTRSLTQRINQFQKRIESILETDAHATDPEAPAFEASRDLAMVRDLAVGLPDDHVDRGIVIFSRLAGLFEAGVLLENQDGVWKAQALFQEGHPRPLQREKAATISLPRLSPMTVAHAPAEALLKKLGLQELDEKNQYRALLIKPVPDFAYLLLTNLPDLWLKDHINHTLKSIADGFAG